ncbi:ArsR family transcriptional regulator [Paenibacillus psychroresistens]|uniref:DNA topoisomerase (ATP-hydrolyzing) n=2 Tax=Paenibacillus psychroresistens TaxID=1778678 RepID=A0A6B8RZE3_9BACL|nr:ArsR family transcriptional regulator [Paenibacillus psychroresistens]
MSELKQLFNHFVSARYLQKPSKPEDSKDESIDNKIENEMGTIFYSGQYRGTNGFRWDPQQRNVSQLLGLDSDKAAKVLAALGNKQRLDILTAVLQKPLTGPEIVEQLNMGTTGQLYHHTKALLGADLLVQEDRGGKYSIPSHRSLPFLLLLAASSDLLDTSDYIELTETRNNAAAYLGTNQGAHDPHHLLWAVLENSIIEHQAGYCTEINLIIQGELSITVADNGRGIPIQALPNSTKTPVQTVLTELGHYNSSASVVAPGELKGINMAVVNALSYKLSIEVRREGKVFHQTFKHGIPQSELLVTGVTKETGTSVTFMPDQDIFNSSFDKEVLSKHLIGLGISYPKLKINILD